MTSCGDKSPAKGKVKVKVSVGGDGRVSERGGRDHAGSGARRVRRGGRPEGVVREDAEAAARSAIRSCSSRELSPPKSVSSGVALFHFAPASLRLARLPVSTGKSRLRAVLTGVHLANLDEDSRRWSRGLVAWIAHEAAAMRKLASSRRSHRPSRCSSPRAPAVTKDRAPYDDEYGITTGDINDGAPDNDSLPGRQQGRRGLSRRQFELPRPSSRRSRARAAAACARSSRRPRWSRTSTSRPACRSPRPTSPSSTCSGR